jgi:hypothetical protein
MFWFAGVTKEGAEEASVSMEDFEFEMEDRKECSSPTAS